jgi:hypothetical protein
VPAILPIGSMLPPIVVEMAALAERSKVIETVIILVMIYVCHSQYHSAAGDGVRLVVLSSTPLAAVLSPAEADEPADKASLRVIFLVVNRHVCGH